MSNFFLKLAFILLLLSIFEIGLTQTQTQTQTSTVGIDAQYSANIMDSQLHNSSTLSKNSPEESIVGLTSVKFLFICLRAVVRDLAFESSACSKLDDLVLFFDNVEELCN